MSLPQTARPAWVDHIARAAATVSWNDAARPATTPGADVRTSAVLVLLGGVVSGCVVQGESAESEVDWGDHADVVLLERAATMRRHAGQIAFPGGAVDPGDADAAATALREAQEEVGIEPGCVDVLASLPARYIARSRYMVTPVLGYWRDRQPISVVDPGEVAAVSVVGTDELSDPANRFTVRSPSGLCGPGFAAGGLFVWGFTATVLDMVLNLGGWQRPWDDSVNPGWDELPRDDAGFQSR